MIRQGLKTNGGDKRQISKGQDSFDRIVDWQSVYKNPPDTLPLYTTRQKIKDQVLFDTWKPLLEDIQSIQKIVTKEYKRLWNASNEILEEFIMEIMPNIDDAALGELRITEVEEKRESSLKVIEQLTEVNKEILNDYLMKPIKLITLAKNFIKKTEADLKLEVTTKICDG
jgi:hypothetical protein